ncbi:HAMP domain-containing histidine kinase [Pelagibacteraceae bacterium]|jgi:two-component system sensor histidine kinase ChvG|nr:HAMP domain-containing histidine kinase [Pelagibacteraceae bacterium]
MKRKKSASILKKFLLFNLLVFSILGLFTILYLQAIQPNLVKQRTLNHLLIIENTSDHLNRLNVIFDNENIKLFLLSTRFLFQGLDRVQFYNYKGNIIGDTNILDLDQGVFSKTDLIIQENMDNNYKQNEKQIKKTLDVKNLKNQDLIKNNIMSKFQKYPLVVENKINENYFVSTLDAVNINGKQVGYIIVSEQANDILFAVDERKNFIIRTVLAVALVILIFSLFLNKYILKPIKFLVMFTESIKAKADKPINVKNLFVREDEIGKLTQSIDEMTSDLQQRTNRAETFSTDLAHEIRNPLASLKGASELLDKTHDQQEREKLLKIINHDVERIERLITDYSQMLKDEAALSREKMSKIDLNEIILNIVDDFKQNLNNQNKKIEIDVVYKSTKRKKLFIFGIENRLEQVFANLLDNSISFSKNNNKIEIEINETTNNFVILVKDEGPGFSETSTQKIFKRFYSNRPTKFGKHSGLGLNIVKNIVELHKGKIFASNRDDFKGAKIELLLPKFG